MSRTADRHQPRRSVFLTDGVVAIAVTLLALDLKPILPNGASGQQLAHYLRDHGNQYFSFLLAFWLIARYWMVHHRIFADVRELDTAAMWSNLLFLFGITCLPLTTEVQSSYPSGLATACFAANLLLVSMALTLVEGVLRRRGLTGEPESADGRTLRRWHAAGTAAVPIIVIALAWVVPRAQYFFVLLLVADVPARIARRRLEGSRDTSPDTGNQP